MDDQNKQEPTEKKEDEKQAEETGTASESSSETVREGSDTNPSPSMTKKVTLLAAVLIVIIVVFLCLKSGEEKKNPKNAGELEPEKPVVTVYEADREDIMDWVFCRGTARAVKRDSLIFETNGKVVEIGDKEDQDGNKIPGSKNKSQELREGDKIYGPKKGEKLGQLLAKVDDRDARQNVEVAENSISEAESRKKVADDKLKRTKNLFKKEVVSRSDLDLAESEASQAAAELKTAKTRLEMAKVALERTKLYAPYNGIIAYLNIQKGQYFTQSWINSKDEASALTTVPIVIIDPTQFEITLEVPTFDGTMIAKGQPAIFIKNTDMAILNKTGSVDENKYIKGFVYSVNPAVNPGGRSIQVKVRTDDNKKATTLMDGMYMSCGIVVEMHKNAVVVPLTSLIFRKQDVYLFVVDKEGKARRKKVKMGIVAKFVNKGNSVESVEIISGVKEGEKVVTEGQHRLVDGQPVQISTRKTKNGQTDEKPSDNKSARLGEFEEVVEDEADKKSKTKGDE